MKWSLLAFGLVSVIATTSEAASFHALGLLPGNDPASFAYGVSDYGKVAVGNAILDHGEVVDAFRWTPSNGLELLRDLGPFDLDSVGIDVSGDGRVVSGAVYHSSGKHEAFLWSADAGLKLLGHLREVDEYSYAQALSTDGNIAFGNSGTFMDGHNEIFRWTPVGGMVGLGEVSGSDYSYVAAVSADGAVAAGIASFNREARALRWTESTGLTVMEDVASLATISQAEGVSSNGEFIVGTLYIEDRTEGFRWSESQGVVRMGAPLVADARLVMKSVANNGTVVGYPLGGSEIGAFIWTERRGYQSIQELLENKLGLEEELTGWRLLQAWDISADGKTIVGVGINPSGQDEAWLATIPEPNTFTSVLIALLSLLGSRLGMKRRG